MTKKYNVKYLTFSLVITLFLTSMSMFSQTMINSSNIDDLDDLVEAAVGGATFIVEDGTYNDISTTFEDVQATEENPIIVKAENVGGVKLTGESKFNLKRCSYVTIEGFVFDIDQVSTIIKIEGSNNVRITRNVFDQEQTSSSKWVYIGGMWDDKTYPFANPSHHNRIDHNTFQNKNLPGHYITIDGNTDEATDTGYQSQYDRIDHNHFKNNGPRATNEQESIRVGWSEMSMSSGYTTVEFNLFEDCDGDPEIVSVKSSDNIVRHNTFKNSYGTLSLRHGNRNRVEGNYFFGNGKEIGLSPDGATLYTGGIRIYGTDHVIINNYFEGLNGTKWDAPITLTLGDKIDGTSTSWSSHFRAERVLIAYNTLVNNAHGIEIGYNNPDSDGDPQYTKDLADITIANNLITGSENALVEIINGEDQGNNITWLNNLMYPTGDAVTLAGATTTVFNGTTDAINENPELVLNTDIIYDKTSGVWKTTADSPLYESESTETVSDDIDGQDRPDISNPGADQFSIESIRFLPLTTSDVGPYALGDGIVLESLSVTDIEDFDAAGGEQISTVTSNTSWLVTKDSDWITVNPINGVDDGSITISVDTNTGYDDRSGMVTVSGENISRTINVNQAGSARTNLINTGEEDDPVTIFFVSAENSSKDEVAINTLDKNMSSVWTAADGDIVSGDYKGDGEYIIYDLGSKYALEFLQFNTTDKGDAFGFQILVSNTGTEDSDFSMILPTSGDLLFTATGTTEFNKYEISAEAQYVKVIGYGRFNSDGDDRESAWSAIGEIEFYGEAEGTAAIEDFDFNKNVLVYPVPAKNTLNIKMLEDKGINNVKIFSLDGRLVIEKQIEYSNIALPINVETLATGSYILNLSGTQGNVSKMILITD